MASENSSDRRNILVYNREQFDDYLVALMARIRFDDEADRIISGESSHPLLNHQFRHSEALGALRIVPFSAMQLIEDPIGCYVQFTRSIASALSAFPAPEVPDVGDLGLLGDLYTLHRKAQRFIYDVIARTLKVGSSMHYARNVKFGAGLHLLNTIVVDNRQTTTRSLMTIFATLLKH